MSDEEENTSAPKTGRRAKETAKRELEQAPIMLRKASVILLIGALLPFFSGLIYASKAKFEVGELTKDFPWAMWLALKVAVLLGGWIAYECAQVRAGEKPKSVLAGLANAHPLAGKGLAGVIWIASLVGVFLVDRVFVQTGNNGLVKEVFQLGALAELMTLILAFFSITHIYEYEHGGKFNPMIPLLMIGPGIAGVLNLIASIAAFSNPHTMIAALGLVGSVIVAAGGGLAIKTMVDSMKEAKVQGEEKKAAMREARRKERGRK